MGLYDFQLTAFHIYLHFTLRPICFGIGCIPTNSVMCDELFMAVKL